MSKGQTSGDATGWKRGEKGYAKGGQWDKDASPPKVSFDDKKLYGPTHGREEVGARAVTGGKYGSDHD
jgi:hypothetical protein